MYVCMYDYVYVYLIMIQHTFFETPKKSKEFAYFRNDKLELKLVHSSLNGTRVVAIPTDTQYNAWNYLAIR